MSDQVMEELWSGISPAANSTDFVNAVVDRLVELEIDLQDVTLSEMKTLMARAYRRKVQGAHSKRKRSVSDCVIAS